MKTTTGRVYVLLWSVCSAVLLATVNPAARIDESTVMRPVRGGKIKISKLDSSAPSLADKPRISMRSSISSSRRSQELQQQPYVQSDLPDVSVSCSVSGLVVRVRTSFYGHGASKDDLTLGSTCRSNGVLRPYGDLLFTYPLMECDGQREMGPGYLVYKFVLHYEPSPGLDVDIECRFQRYHHVYQLAVRPTWQSPTMRKTLEGRFNDFHIQFMDDSWTNPASQQSYHLGEPVNIQVSTSYLPPGGMLYIRRCYAALAGGSVPSQKYTIIDNVGCLLESQRDPSGSQFLSPRTNDTLRFSISAFQFTSDPGSQVVIHCKLFVSSEDPSPSCKSCTYRENGWRALIGDHSICECCDSRCVSSKTRRAMIGSASSGPLQVSDPLASQEGSVPPSSSSLVSSMEDRELEDLLDFEMKTTEIPDLQSPEDLWGEADVAKDDSVGDEPSSTDLEEEEQVATQIDNSGAPLEPVLDTLGFTSWLMEERGVMEERDEGEEMGVEEERDEEEEEMDVKEDRDEDEEEDRNLVEEEKKDVIEEERDEGEEMGVEEERDEEEEEIDVKEDRDDDEEEDRNVVEEEKKDVIEEERDVMEKEGNVMDLESFRRDDSGHLELLDGSGHIIIEEFSVTPGGDELGSQGEFVGKRSEMSEARAEQEEGLGERQTAHLLNEGERDPLLGGGVWKTMSLVTKGDSQLSKKQGLNMKQPLGIQNADDQIELYTAGSEEAQRTEWKEEDRVSSEVLVETDVLDGKQMTWFFTWR